MNNAYNHFCRMTSLWLAAIIAAGISNAALAVPTLIDFEDLPAGTLVTNQYGIKGVLFDNKLVDADPAPHSGTRVLRSAFGEIFSPVPITMTFTSAQAVVKLFAKSTGTDLNGTLTAFDASDNPIATDSKLVPVASFVMLQVVDPDMTPSIARAELRLENGIFYMIDDLEFDGQPPAPPPAVPPAVTITTPQNGAKLDVTTLDIAGTVTGEGLLNIVKLTVIYPRPPEFDNLPPFTSDLALTGTGNTRQFSLKGFTGVPLGPISITVTAENFAAQSGSDTVTITNLPIAIQTRFDAQGGFATFGDFNFGTIPGDCTVAVYERGAISMSNGRVAKDDPFGCSAATDISPGTTFVILGDILTKWLNLDTPFNPDGVGCPIAEERMTFEGDATVQEFEHGRIYRSLALPGRAAFVPPAFAKVLCERGEELKIGIPVSDPTESSSQQNQTWLYQNFVHPGRPDLIPYTMEIRGSPPVLYLERQAGDWLHGNMEPTPEDLARGKTAATVWESFPCSNLQGPCTVGPDPNVAPQFPPQNIQNIAATFCNGMLYIPGLVDFCFPVCEASDCPACDRRLPEFADRPGCCCCMPPEWAPVRGQYDATPVFGAILSAHMADIDNGFTHETHNGTCPGLPDIIGGPTGITCVSDYEFFVFPLGPQIDLSPLPSFFGKKNTTRIKTEYEVAYAALAHQLPGRAEGRGPGSHHRSVDRGLRS